ncbi:MAG: tyrosine-type recombinase/integrase [Candidatus Margulisiibacteriota bacterium]
MINRNLRWSRAKIIREIRLLFKNNPKITPEEIRIKHSTLYGATQHGRHFNGWRQAVEIAGFISKYNNIVKKSQKMVILTRKRTQSWSKIFIQEQIKQLFKKGIPLDGGYARKNYYKLLHAAEHRRYYGSWRKAVESVGINYKVLTKKIKKTKKKRKVSFSNSATGEVIRQYLCCLRERNFSPAGIGRYLDAIKMFDCYLDGVDLSKITESDVRRFVIICGKKGYSPATIAKYYAPLRQLFDFSVRRGIVKINPIRSYYFPRAAQRITAVITEEELRSFLKYLDKRVGTDEYVKYRDKLLVELMAYCGLRRNEVRCLMLKHVDLDKGVIIIRQSKFKKDRLIPLNSKLIEDLRVYLRLRKPARSRYLILINNKSNPLDLSYFCYLVKRLKVESGLKCKITPKILRSTFATLLFEKGVSLKSIQELMGHTSPGTTFQYIHASVDYLRKEIEKHPLLSS